MAYKQAQDRKKHLLKTYRETKNYWGAGVWFDEDTGRYRKYSHTNTPGYAKSLRKVSNKKVRKAKDIGNYSNYKKLYDYWWILY